MVDASKKEAILGVINTPKEGKTAEEVAKFD